VWITTVLPPGLTGLILAGAFAAAISSLDSVLAALSQTSLSAWYGREKLERDGHGPQMVFRSRVMVVIWAAILSGFAILMASGYRNNDNKNLIDLAFGRRSLHGLILGVCVSILIVAWVRPELRQLLGSIGAHDLAKVLLDSRPRIADPWFYPINAAITLLGACLPLGRMTGAKN
jgi:hypothetical protein